MNTNKTLSSEVILIDETGLNLGKVKLSEARQISGEKNLDLVEINKQGGLSICKIMDEGRWKYEQKKKSKQNKNHNQSLKEMNFGVRIDPHDQDIKIQHIKEFLQKGHLVKVSISMKGREKSHADIAYDKINTIIKALDEYGKIHTGSKKIDSGITVVLQPLKH